MTEAILAAILKSIGTSVGINFALRCASDMASSTLSSTTTGIFALTQKIYKSDPSGEMEKVLKETDIEFKRDILYTLIEKIDSNKIHNKALKQCLDGMKECLADLEKELKIIHQKLEYNKSLWLLPSMRSYKFTNSPDKIRSLFKVLVERRDMLFKMLDLPGLIDSDTLSESTIETNKNLFNKNKKH